MMKRENRALNGGIGLLLAVLAVCAAGVAVVCPPDATPRMKLAAAEIRRYVYLRTGELLEIRTDGSEGSDRSDGRIVLKTDAGLAAEQLDDGDASELLGEVAALDALGLADLELEGAQAAGEVAHDDGEERGDGEADEGEAGVEHEHRGGDREDHGDVGEDGEDAEGEGLAERLDVAGAARE